MAGMTDLLQRPAPLQPDHPATVTGAVVVSARARPAPSDGDLRLALRPDAGGRRPVDRGLAGGLRAWLEDGAAPLVGDRPAAVAPIVVDRWWAASPAVTRTGGASSGGRAPITVAAARQAMVGCLFRQLVVTGTISRPFTDAVAGLRADGWEAEVVRFVTALPRATRNALRREVDAHGLAMAARWSPLPAGWLPRTTARLCVPVAGGRVLLRATASLLLGAPPVDRTAHCLLDVRAGRPHEAHAADRRFLALVETLRAGAPPCRVATWYPAAGHLDTEDPTDASLAATVPAVVDAVRRLAAGGEPGG